MVRVPRSGPRLVPRRTTRSRCLRRRLVCMRETLRAHGTGAQRLGGEGFESGVGLTVGAADPSYCANGDEG